jgi:hypothetical protein
LLSLLAPLLAAFFAFLLCRYVTGRFAPALIGGYIFGFSPYMLGHLLGHLDLVLVFPIPAAVHLTLRRIDERISSRAFVTLLALLLAFFFLCSQELTLTLVLLGGLTLLLAYVFAPALRTRLRDTIGLCVLAGAVAAVVVGVFLYYALSGDVLHRFFNRYSDTVVADTLGFLVPTSAEAVGHGWFSSISDKFVGGIAENGVYIGLPFAAATVLYAVTRWRAAATRVLACMLGITVVLMLGSHLHFDGSARFHIGSHHTIPLPWLAISKIPFFHEVAPARLGVYMFLIVAVIVSMWLAEAPAGWGARARWGVAALGVAALLPNLGNVGWHSRPENPSLFTGDGYRRVFRPGEIVLALPFAQNGPSMLWQAESGFHFRLPEGYVGALLPSDYVGDLPPAAVGSDPALTPDPAVIRSFISRRGVGAVVVGDREAAQWAPALAAAGLHGQQTGGAVTYEVPRR